MKKVAVLGGSGAFTPALARALAARADELPELELVLLGLDAGRTRLVAEACARFAGARGVRHRYATALELERALSGADVVVNQVRPGGLAGRASDETFPLEFDLPGDETLGPGGLAAAMRGAAAVRTLCEAAARHAPQAWFVQLTNPMSILLATLGDLIGPRVFGLCELPGETLRRAVALLGLGVGEVECDYAGLNHQGWFYRLEHAGADLRPALFAALEAAGEPGFFRVPVARMRELGALPLPYLALELEPRAAVARQQARAGTRAAELAGLGARLFASYAAGGAELPDELTARATPWYDQALVPALVALLGGPAAELYISEPNRGHLPQLPDEAVVEKRALLDTRGVHALPLRTPVPAHLAIRIRSAQRFEALAARCAREPAPGRVVEALAALPGGVSAGRLAALAERVLEAAR